MAFRVVRQRAYVQQSVNKGIIKTLSAFKLHKIVQQIFNTLYQILKYQAWKWGQEKKLLRPLLQPNYRRKKNNPANGSNTNRASLHQTI